MRWGGRTSNLNNTPFSNSPKAQPKREKPGRPNTPAEKRMAGGGKRTRDFGRFMRKKKKKKSRSAAPGRGGDHLLMINMNKEERGDKRANPLKKGRP